MQEEPLSRPWYLSLTLIWEDAAGDGEQQLCEALKQLRREGQRLPLHHRIVPRESRHTTAFAILKVNRSPCESNSLRSFTRELFTQLATQRVRKSLKGEWSQKFPRGLSLVARILRVFDDGTTIQFRDDETLAHFRNGVRAVLTDPVSKLITVYPIGLIEPLLNHCSKSRGPKAFGSIARSPCTSDKPNLRWEMPLDKFTVTLTFHKVHLLVSDDSLSNPRNTTHRGSVEDYKIP